MKIYEIRLIFNWSLFLRVKFMIFQHRSRQWAIYHLNVYWHIFASLGLNELTMLSGNIVNLMDCRQDDGWDRTLACDRDINTKHLDAILNAFILMPHWMTHAYIQTHVCLYAWNLNYWKLFSYIYVEWLTDRCINSYIYLYLLRE